MARLFLIRHGQPEEHWGAGAADPGLSQDGQEQAARAAQLLAAFGALRLVSSPLRRAQETAAAAAALQRQTVALEPRIGEIVAPAGVADRRAWLSGLLLPGSTWGGTDPQIQAWRVDVLAAVRAVGADTAMFSHFVAINVVTGAALGTDLVAVCRPDLASITEFAIERGAIRLVSGAPLENGAQPT